MRRVVLRRKEDAWKARSWGGGKDASVRATQARQEPRQRHRELLKFREGKARQIQRLQLRRFCATFEGVRVAVQSQTRGLVAFN